MFPTGLDLMRMISRSYTPQLPCQVRRNPPRRCPWRQALTAPRYHQISSLSTRRCQGWKSRSSLEIQKRCAKPSTAPPDPSARSTTGDILSEVSIWARLFLQSHSPQPLRSLAWTTSCTLRWTWKSAPATAAGAAQPSPAPAAAPATAYQYQTTGSQPKDPPPREQSVNLKPPQRNPKPSESSTLKTRWPLLRCLGWKSKRVRWRWSRGRRAPGEPNL